MIQDASGIPGRQQVSGSSVQHPQELVGNEQPSKFFPHLDELVWRFCLKEERDVVTSSRERLALEVVILYHNKAIVNILAKGLGKRANVFPKAE
jgi:hypothetical protein